MARKLNYRPFPQRLEVEKVQVTFDRTTGSRRHPPAVIINRFGYAKTNVEGAEDWMAYLEDQGVDPKQAWVTNTFNRAQGLIFVHAAQETDDGAVALELDEEKGIFTTHFGAVFKQCPSMRPTTTVEASFEPRLDNEGKPCLSIKVKGAPAKRKGAADPEELIARAEEEAAKKAAKAENKKKLAAAKEGSTKTPSPAPEGTGQAE
ncbi:MAG TPA: hypothetical protein VD973_25785 [Symbiobacteriaceae bacterium]|nr:hypothetical protein [Symbiobacteriaceae bacterium]